MLKPRRPSPRVMDEGSMDRREEWLKRWDNPAG
jgi:hypothetical protein